MLRLIRGQTAACQAIGKGDSLMERQTQPFSGDSIDRSGGVADERNAAAIDPLQAAVSGNGASFGGDARGTVQACGKLRKLRQRFVQTQVRIPRDECDTNLIRRNGRDVNLASG